jgi:hypothetical protein
LLIAIEIVICEEEVGIGVGLSQVHSHIKISKTVLFAENSSWLEIKNTVSIRSNVTWTIHACGFLHPLPFDFELCEDWTMHKTTSGHDNDVNMRREIERGFSIMVKIKIIYYDSTFYSPSTNQSTAPASSGFYDELRYSLVTVRYSWFNL